jgi:Zn-dependent peptidase ImmA (M78 family)
VDRLLHEHRIRKAPVSVERIARGLGVEIRHQPAEDDLSGFLYRDKKRKMAIIGVNSKQHANRRNFTAAHELGHYLLHEFETVHVDRTFEVWLRSEASSQGTNLEEKEANLFAAELLMPYRFIEADVNEIGTIDPTDEDALENLAKRYGVSPQAMAFRLAYLGYLKQ